MKSMHSYLLFVGISLFGIFGQAAWAGRPRTLPTAPEIREALGNGSIPDLYKHPEGYRRFAEKYFRSNMDVCYIKTSLALGGIPPDFDWGTRYHGTTAEFDDERISLFRNDKPVAYFSDPEGFKRYAMEKHDGIKRNALDSASAVFSKAELEQLGWLVGRRAGSSQTYPTGREIIEAIRNDSESKKYLTPAGYRLFAERYFRSNLDACFKETSKALGPSFKNLGWGKHYFGIIAEFDDERNRLFLHDKPVMKYFGSQGFQRYATERYGGDKQITLANASAVLSKSELLQLGWGKSTKGGRPRIYPTAPEIREALGNGSPPAIYVGRKGYRSFAAKFFKGNMHACFTETTKALGQAINELKWGKCYRGFIAQFDDEQKGSLENKKPPVKLRQSTFVKASTGLSKTESTRPGQGKAYSLTVSKYLQTRLALFNGGKPVEIFVGPKGYIAYADLKCGGDMDQAYVDASTVLTEAEFAQLGWGEKYKGSTLKYSQEYSRLFQDGVPIADFVGRGGLLNYARKWYSADQNTAFSNVSIALTKQQFAKLNWHFSDEILASQTSVERSRLFDGLQPIPRYAGQQGYLNYADDFYLHNMLTTHQQVRSALTEEEFLKLGWGHVYDGSTMKFAKERSQLIGKNGFLLKFMGQNGYQQYAQEHYFGEMEVAFKNVSAVLSADEFASLDWGSVFNGTPQENVAIRSYLMSRGLSQATKMWFGKPSGLMAVTEAYLKSVGFGTPFPKILFDKTGAQFRAVLNNDELQSLGWDYPKTSRTECAEQLGTSGKNK